MDYMQAKLARRLVQDGDKARPGDEALFYASYGKTGSRWRAVLAFLRDLRQYGRARRRTPRLRKALP